MAHALTDAQVAGELKKMVAFIKQEAAEKAHEIEIKANQEFAIEEAKLVRQETAAIDALYEKKLKNAELSQQKARSTVTNKTRLQTLSARQRLLQDIFEQARNKLADVSKDQGKYKDIVKNLILEGLYALNESSIQVRGRKKDFDVLKSQAEEAAKEYKSASGQDVEVKVDEESPLPEDSHGGVYIVGSGGKITINNTLEERLNLIESDSLPAVRASVFGENPNRKFYS